MKIKNIEVVRILFSGFSKASGLTISILIISFIFKYTYASESDTGFVASGKPIVKIYSSLEKSLYEDNQGFAVDRAYLGYAYKMSPDYSIAVKLDIGSPNDESEYSKIKRYAFFKEAALKYKHEKLKINFGLIGLYQYKIQEKIWGHRYLYKSFQDQHKFGSSADLGILLAYDFSKTLSADLSIINGEGYKNLQKDNAFKYTAGITSKFNGVILRAYADMEKKDYLRSCMSFFAGYDKDKIHAGAEFNYVYSDNETNEKLYGYSLYASVDIAQKMQLFTRYDYLNSGIREDYNIPWNIENDGSAIIGGIQYMPHKNIKIALNYRDWYPYAENLDNVALIGLNFEYKI